MLLAVHGKESLLCRRAPTELRVLRGLDLFPSSIWLGHYVGRHSLLCVGCDCVGVSMWKWCVVMGRRGCVVYVCAIDDGCVYGVCVWSLCMCIGCAMGCVHVCAHMYEVCVCVLTCLCV